MNITVFLDKDRATRVVRETFPDLVPEDCTIFSVTIYITDSWNPRGGLHGSAVISHTYHTKAGAESRAARRTRVGAKGWVRYWTGGLVQDEGVDWS